MKPLSQRLTNRTLISHGDMSAAYRARDTALERDVFLKVLHPHLAAETDLRARFEREARAAARLDIPQLVRIHEVGEDPVEGPFMLLEWVEGETLRAAIMRSGKLSAHEVRTLAETMLAALAALHDAGVLHRDVKPENILRRKDGVFKLTDFSLALLADAPKLTHHQAVVGTPAYLAPELARGKTPSEQSDLFALGVVLYESATGNNPFAADNILESLRRVREVEPDWNALNALQDDKLAQLIRSCLAKEPGHRLASAQDAQAALAGTMSFPNPRRTLRIVFAAAALLLIAVGIALWPHDSETPVSVAQLDTSAVVKLPVIDSLLSVPDSTAIQPVVSRTDSPVVTKRPQEKPVTVQDTVEKTVVQVADSFNLILDTDPWAHVSMAGVELGTTPLTRPLRVAAGLHTLLLRNTAYPPIQVTVNLNADERKQIDLAHYVQHVSLQVEPWGEVYLDNEHVGTAPLRSMLRVLPGEHRLRITHPSFSPADKTWRAAAGDTIQFNVNMANSEFVVAREVP